MNAKVGRRLMAGIAALTLIGCAPQSPTTQPASLYDRQEQALRDPFGYSPDLTKSDMKVSGNGEFDREGFNRDLNHVLNP